MHRLGLFANTFKQNHFGPQWGVTRAAGFNIQSHSLKDMLCSNRIYKYLTILTKVASCFWQTQHLPLSSSLSASPYHHITLRSNILPHQHLVDMQSYSLYNIIGNVAVSVSTRKEITITSCVFWGCPVHVRMLLQSLHGNTERPVILNENSLAHTDMRVFNSLTSENTLATAL